MERIWPGLNKLSVTAVPNSIREQEITKIDIVTRQRLLESEKAERDDHQSVRNDMSAKC